MVKKQMTRYPNLTISTMCNFTSKYRETIGFKISGLTFKGIRTCTQNRELFANNNQLPIYKQGKGILYYQIKRNTQISDELRNAVVVIAMDAAV